MRDAGFRIIRSAHYPQDPAFMDACDELGMFIIVATPGRLIDLMERKVAKLETIADVVMDEADEMLNMGFTDSINAILEKVPEDRNTLMFSATMSPESRVLQKIPARCERDYNRY